MERKWKLKIILQYFSKYCAKVFQIYSSMISLAQSLMCLTSKHHYFHTKMISGTWDSLRAAVWCFITLLVLLNHYVYLQNRLLQLMPYAELTQAYQYQLSACLVMTYGSHNCFFLRKSVGGLLRIYINNAEKLQQCIGNNGACTSKEDTKRNT